MNDMFYFDYNSTTPLAPEVAAAIQNCLIDCWGNPSNGYGLGRKSKRMIEEARQNIARLLNADVDEIIFTSGGTESINTAINSAVRTTGKTKVIISAVEHYATIRFCQNLPCVETVVIPVDQNGFLRIDDIGRAIDQQTAIVSVMLANNETGVIYPIAEIAEICRKKGVLFHSDAVAAAGYMHLDVRELGVDFLSISSHKIYGPKGVGALYIRKGIEFYPYIIGGGQEQGRRAGTENLTGIAGFGKAAEVIMNRLNESSSVKILRDRLENEILSKIPGAHSNAPREPRLPNVANISFDLVKSSDLLFELDRYGICASSGAACKSGNVEPSHVLTAMGFSRKRALGAVRFSIGYWTKPHEVDYLLEILPPVVYQLRKHADIINPDFSRNWKT